MNAVSRTFPVLYLLLNGAAYCVLAWLFVVDPVAWFERLQIQLLDPAGYSELKTMYIAMMGSLGIFFIAGTLADELQLPALFLCVLSFLALALVRSWGIYIEGVFNDLAMQFLVIESVGLVAGMLALYCWTRNTRRRRNPYY